jgi:hypothetical protein
MFHQSAQVEMGSTFEKNAGENRGWEANFAKKATFVCIVDTALTSKCLIVVVSPAMKNLI